MLKQLIKLVRALLLWLDPLPTPVPRPMATSFDLSAEDQNLLDTFEKGQRLRMTLNSEGYQDLLDIFESRVAQAEFHLINAEGVDLNRRVDKEILFKLHTRARAMREIFQNVQHDIHAVMSDSESIPDIVAASTEQHGGNF